MSQPKLPTIPRAEPEEIQSCPVLSAITTLMETDRQKISQMSGMGYRAGWEGWLYIEAAYAILTSSQYKIEREQPVYKTGKLEMEAWCTHATEKFDAKTNPQPDMSHKRIGYELKCGNQSDDFEDDEGVLRGKFQDRITRDTEKILEGISPERIGEAGARVYAIGVTPYIDDLSGFEKVEQETGKQFRYWQSSPVKNGECWYVLWWYKDFP